MPQLGPAEVLVILVVALLVFGPKRLPEVGRQVGRGLRELRTLQDTVRDELNDVLHHDDPDNEPPRYPTTPASAPVPSPGSGQHAPSRFRPAGAAALGAGAMPAADQAATSAAEPSSSTWPPASPSASTQPAHAPSRFRAPGR